LKEKIREWARAREEQILGGKIEDYAQYRATAEYLQALRDVLVLCDEVETDMTKGE
jgi:hypothetical protein